MLRLGMLSLLMAWTAQAAPTLVRVSPPAGQRLDATALARAVELYLKDLPVQLAVDAPSAEPPTAETLRGVGLSVWIRYDAVHDALDLQLWEPRGPQQLEALTVSVPGSPDGSFYRLVGLKVRSLLQQHLMPELPAEEPAPPPEVQAPAAPPPPASRWLIELGPAGALHADLRQGLGASAAFLLTGTAWSAGLEAAFERPSCCRTDVSRGSVWEARAAATVRWHFVRGAALTAFALADTGVRFGQLEAVLLDGGETASASAQALSLSLGLGLSVRLAPHFGLAVVAREEVLPQQIHFLTRGTPLYASGHWRTQLEARLQAPF